MFDQPNIRYGLLSNMEVCDKVVEEDYRMPLPKGCPEPSVLLSFRRARVCVCAS